MSSTEEDTPVRTGGGDDGKSSLIDGDRRFKDDIAFEALGTIDEAQVALGVCRSLLPSVGRDYKKLDEDLTWIQYRMLVAGGVIASPLGSPVLEAMDTIDAEDLATLETIFTRWRKKTHIEPRFFIGGDTRLGAEFDRSRTVIRRAERAVVRVVRERGGHEHTMVSKFLNMLSDFGFVMARWSDSQGPL